MEVSMAQDMVTLSPATPLKIVLLADRVGSEKHSTLNYSFFDSVNELYCLHKQTTKYKQRLPISNLFGPVSIRATTFLYEYLREQARQNMC